MEFGKKDIVRHQLVQRIVEAYQAFDESEERRRKEESAAAEAAPGCGTLVITLRQQTQFHSNKIPHGNFNKNWTSIFPDRREFITARCATSIRSTATICW